MVVKPIPPDSKQQACVKCGKKATHIVTKNNRTFPVCDEHNPQNQIAQIVESKEFKPQSLIDVLRNEGHICKLQGKEYVLLSGLLKLGHENGLESMQSEIIHMDLDTQSAVVKCTIIGSRGTFDGIGDATPKNLAKRMLPSFIRMAETRAKCRALRFYLGIGMCARDELPPQTKED